MELLLSGPISRFLQPLCRAELAALMGFSGSRTAKVTPAPPAFLTVLMMHFAKVCQIQAESGASKLLLAWLHITVSHVRCAGLKAMPVSLHGAVCLLEQQMNR